MCFFEGAAGGRTWLPYPYARPLSVFLIQVLPQVWRNSKSQKAAKAFGFIKIATGVLLLINIDSRNPQNVA
jgi:hypothetical protein